MVGNGDAQMWLVWVFEDLMGTGGMVNEKSGPLQRADDFFRFEGW